MFLNSTLFLNFQMFQMQVIQIPLNTRLNLLLKLINWKPIKSNFVEQLCIETMPIHLSIIFQTKLTSSQVKNKWLTNSPVALQTVVWVLLKLGPTIFYFKIIKYWGNPTGFKRPKVTQEVLHSTQEKRAEIDCIVFAAGVPVYFEQLFKYSFVLCFW